MVNSESERANAEARECQEMTTTDAAQAGDGHRGSLQLVHFVRRDETQGAGERYLGIERS